MAKFEMKASGHQDRTHSSLLCCYALGTASQSLLSSMATFLPEELLLSMKDQAFALCIELVRFSIRSVGCAHIEMNFAAHATDRTNGVGFSVFGHSSSCPGVVALFMPTARMGTLVGLGTLTVANGCPGCPLHCREFSAEYLYPHSERSAGT